ncbi:hypothetical protein B0T25DRAFT_618289 [Lasiosphaeria hispida]|uniref:Tyrosinase copper-binding domain-containing protein n=1 Tax=Lasiosphaeria hispida TaxID=260671 RepID=A0AAJ0H5P6_9PEZI|nr:hypothetical protein B0T25DRAFT_618289 [Lasiosphaeria hispida]
MRGIQSVAVVSSLLSGLALAGPLEKKWSFKDVVIRNGDFPLDVVDKLEEATMPKIEAHMAKKAAAGKTKCTLENAAIRREWSDLSVPEREDYVKAVLCLMSKPAKAPKDEAPGALSRFDDFVATHMTMAGQLHDPTHLFGAHRYYIWIYEKALREECGYKGYQPYMNYDRYAADPIHSAMFNGNASSMGGNGLPTNYGGIPQPFPKPYDKIPQAGGGGCVTEGPFKDMVVSLGPKATVVRNIPPNPRADGLGSNPRCLRRDVNKASTMGARANYTYSLIMDNPDVNAFYNRYLGSPPLRNEAFPWGLHNAGHFTIGGDPGGDFYCSPGDPAFYFHHGMLDRVWWIWQMQDPDTRVDLIPTGEVPAGHTGHGRRVRKEETVDLGWTAPEVPLLALHDQLGGLEGEMCYIYV